MTAPVDPPADEVTRRRHRADAVVTLRDALMALRSPGVGMSAVADEAQGRASRTADRPVVLVLGEPERGKSSLVQLLAPHEVDDERALDEVYTTVVPPTGHSGPRVRWVGPDGSTVAGRHGAVGAVIPWRECRLGPDVTLIDTPCVGGVQGAQAAVSRSLAMSATAAVFVTDAGAPLSQQELEYVEHLAAPVDSLVVVVTKTDLYPGSWRQVVDDARTVLAERRGRTDVVVLGLSNRLAHMAEQAGDARRAAELVEASGLGELRRNLLTTIARADSAPLTGALHLARAGLLQHRAALTRRATAVGADADAATAVREHDALLAALDARSSRWDQYLGRDMARIRADVASLAQQRVEVWRTHWRDALESGRSRDAATDAAGEQMLWQLAAIRTEVLEQARDELRSLVQALFLDVEVPMEVGRSITTDVTHQSTHVLRPPSALDWDTGVVGQGMMGWNLGGTLAGVVASLVPGLGPVLQVAGAAGFAWLHRSQRSDRHTRSSLLAEVQRLATAEQAEILRVYDQVLNEARPEIVIAYREHLAAQKKIARDLLAEARKTQSRSAAESAAAAAALDRDIDEVGARIGRLDRSLASLRAVVGSGPDGGGAAPPPVIEPTTEDTDD